MKDYSSILYADPSFIEGMSRLWDFGNVLDEYNTSPSGPLADLIALCADYAAIDEDIRRILLTNVNRLPAATRERLLATTPA